MPISPKVANDIKAYAQKLGRTEAELTASYNAFYTEEKALHPQMNEEQLMQRANFRLYASVKSELRSPAVACDIMVIAQTTARDVTETQRRDAVALWKSNPEEALRRRVVDADGNPIDSRATWEDGRPNPFFGKKIEPTFIRTMFGIGKPLGDKNPIQFFALSQFNEASQTILPEGKTVRLRAIIKGSEGMYTANTYRLAAGQYAEVAPLINKPLLDILREAPPTLKATIGGLMEWHNLHKDDARRVAIVEGDVTYVNRDPNANGNYLIVMEDVTAAGPEMTEAEGITVFTDRAPDFGVASKIIVVGRTTLGQGYNPDTRQADASMPKRVIINAYAVYVDPLYRVPPNEDRVISSK